MQHERRFRALVARRGSLDSEWSCGRARLRRAQHRVVTNSVGFLIKRRKRNRVVFTNNSRFLPRKPLIWHEPRLVFRARKIVRAVVLLSGVDSKTGDCAMSDYELYYWSVPFRGQFVRAVLAFAGKSWTEG